MRNERRNSYKLFIMFVGVFLAGGCTSRAHRVDPIFKDGRLFFSEEQNEDLMEMYVQQRRLKFFKGSTQINTESKTFQKAYQAASQDLVKRNQLIAQIMLLSDVACAQYKSQMKTGAGNLDIRSGVASSLLSGVGSVVGGGTVAAGLSAGSLFINGTKNLVKSKFLPAQLTDLLLLSMDQARERKKSQIKQNMNKPVDEYHISLALVDISEYHALCLSDSGVKEISAALQSNDLDQRNKTINHIAGLEGKIQEIENSILSEDDKNRLKLILRNLQKTNNDLKKKIKKIESSMLSDVDKEDLKMIIKNLQREISELRTNNIEEKARQVEAVFPIRDVW